MAKRYTSTHKWHDKWYRTLPMVYKLAYQYIVDNCDPVGIWEPDEELLNFMIGSDKEGARIDLDHLLAAMGNRVYIMEKGYWWLTKFCDFQYGNLSPKSTSKPIQAYIKMLKSHGLWQAYTKGMGTLKDKDKEKEEEKEVGSDTGFYTGNLDTDHALANRSEAFMQDVLTFKDKYSMDLLTEFIAYWTEPNRSNTKLRCELERTWDTAKRLARWKANSKQYTRGTEQRNDKSYLR